MFCPLTRLSASPKPFTQKLKLRTLSSNPQKEGKGGCKGASHVVVGADQQGYQFALNGMARDEAGKQKLMAMDFSDSSVSVYRPRLWPCLLEQTGAPVDQHQQDVRSTLASPFAFFLRVGAESAQL